MNVQGALHAKHLRTDNPRGIKCTGRQTQRSGRVHSLALTLQLGRQKKRTKLQQVGEDSAQRVASSRLSVPPQGRVMLAQYCRSADVQPLVH